MKVLKGALVEEVAGDLKWLGGGKTLNSGFLVQGFANGVVQPAVAAIGHVNGLKGHELGQEWQKIGSVFFITPRGLVDAFDLVRCASKGFDNLPGTSKRMHQLVNAASFGVRLGGTSCKDDVPFVIDAGVAAPRVDKFAMPGLLLPNKKHGNIAAAFEPCG
jgi:hypothetical protein